MKNKKPLTTTPLTTTPPTELLYELLKDINLDDSFDMSESNDEDIINDEDMKDKDFELISNAFNDYALVDGVLQYKSLLDDTQLHELFENRIDIKRLISDKEIALNYRYTSAHRSKARFITNTLETFLKGVEITDSEYAILRNNLLTRLDKKKEEYFTQLKEEVEKIDTEKVFSFLYENGKDYINYMIVNGLDSTNRDLVVYTLCSYYPWDIRTLCSIDIQNIYEAYREQNIKDKRTYKSQSITNDIDTQMKELLLNNYSDRIIEMYKNKLSFNKIQKKLTEECIANDEIPASIKRYDRSPGKENLLVERPTLLPMRVIKFIIKESDVQISKVGRYSSSQKQ